MNILDSILHQWNRDKDIETLVSAGLFTDKNALQTSLDLLSGSEKENTLLILDEIQAALETYIRTIDGHMHATQKQIDVTLKSELACLSYGSSVNIQNNNKKNRE
jgi:hypothetical protein